MAWRLPAVLAGVAGIAGGRGWSTLAAMDPMGGTGTLTDISRQQLRASIVAENRASLVAGLFAIGLWVFVDRHLSLLVLAVLIVALRWLRTLAVPAVDEGRIERAVVLFMIGKWAVSLILIVVLPIALPIVVIGLLMPILVASTHLTARRFVPMMAAVVVVSALAGVAGYMINIFELEDGVTPWVWQTLCVIVLSVHFMTVSRLTWQTHQQQSLVYNAAMQANEGLRASELELLRSRQRLVAAADEERSRIERDLHDGAQQRLVSVLVQLRLQDQLAEQGHPPDATARQAVADEVEAALHELRQLAHGIYPPLLELEGLPTALAAAARPYGYEVDAGDVGRFDRAVESAVYFCCLEAIQNATKHGGDDVEVTISLTRDGDELNGRIEDDGPGFDPDAIGLGRGLDNMRDRIAAAGGQLAIGARPEGGTAVAFTLSVRDRELGGVS